MKLVSVVVALIFVFGMATEAQAQVTVTEQPEMVWLFYPLPGGSFGMMAFPAKDFNYEKFYGCMAYYEFWAMWTSFALGPNGPGFFFVASMAAAANCGFNAYQPQGSTSGTFNR